MPVPKSKEALAVILVHGLWLDSYAFVAHRHWLSGGGYAPRTFSYPSVRAGLDANSLALARFIRGIEGKAVAIVAHSLGGLVVLNMLALAPDPRIRRIVLMGSPTAGSHCAAVLMRTPALASIVGRSLKDAAGKAAWEIPAGVEVGVLAGDSGFGLGRLIPGLAKPNDGTVAVAETNLPGCSDAIVLPLNHSEMLLSRLCAEQVMSFLKVGRFRHG
jgi:pimeloyl-ACP methyl ester carboxylesterase